MAQPTAPPAGGRRKTPKPHGLLRALIWTTLVAVVPLAMLVGLGWFWGRPNKDLVLHWLVDPRVLLGIAVGLVVALLFWVLMILEVYAQMRPRRLHPTQRFLGFGFVMALCLSVAAPMGMGGYYAWVQRDLVSTVFAPTTSVTTPKATRANPWGQRQRVNVLLLGGDGGLGRTGIRTDTVIVASIDIRSGRTILFSLPRNLRDVPFPEDSPLHDVYPDGFDGPGSDGEYMLNAIYRNVPASNPGILGRTDNEGADALKQGVSTALGLRIDYYMLVNLDGFERIVNAIGGITVNVNERVAINGNTSAGIPPTGWIEPGPDQHLDGFHALWFTRGRYGSTDYKRMERQRCAIKAISDAADPVTLIRRYTQLASAGKRIVRTDIPQELLPAFVDLALTVKKHPPRSVVFEYSDDFNPNDPDFDVMRERVHNAFNPPRQVKPDTSASPGATPTAEPTDKPAATSTADDCVYDPEGPDDSDNQLGSASPIQPLCKEYAVARVVVDVMPKPEILDPQGKAVQGALPRLGFAGVLDVRQGKRFELEFEGEITEERLAEATKMAETLLSNPVIEDFTVSVLPA